MLFTAPHVSCSSTIDRTRDRSPARPIAPSVWPTRP